MVIYRAVREDVALRLSFFLRPPQGQEHVALHAFQPMLGIISLKMLWVTKVCSICNIWIKKKKKTQKTSHKLDTEAKYQFRSLKSPSRMQVEQKRFHSKIWEFLTHRCFLSEKNMKGCTWGRRKQVFNIWSRIWEETAKKLKTKQEMIVKINIDSLNKFFLKWNQTRLK